MQSERNSTHRPRRRLLVVTCGIAVIVLVTGAVLVRRGFAAPPSDPAEVARLRDTGAAALAGLHDVAASASQDRLGAERRAAALDVENQKLRVRVAQLEVAATQPAPTPQAAPGGKAYTVRANERIQDTLDKAKPGDVVLVSPGEYANQTVRVPRGVVLSLNGATLNGGGTMMSPAALVGQNATLVGGTVTGFVGDNERKKAAVQLFGDDATVDGVTVTGVTGAAISADVVQRPRILNNVVRDVTGSWLLFGGGEQAECEAPQVTGNTVERWNTAKFKVPSGPGVNKFTRTVGGTFTNNTFKNGFGPALWGDIGNRKYTIARNTFDGIQSSRDAWDALGIYMEISNGEGAVIEENTFKNIDRKGAAISIAESNGLTVRKNTVDAARIELRDVRDGTNPAKARGFHMAYTGKREFVRTGLKDVTIEDNVLLNGAKPDHLSNGGSTKTPGSWDGNSKKYLEENNIVWRGNKQQ